MKTSAIRITTRKSSCVNARGIPPTTPKVFALLIYPGRGGGTYPGQGVPTIVGGSYPGQGQYLPWSGGIYPGQGGTGSGRDTPTGCGQTDTCKNSTFLYPSDAGGNKADSSTEKMSIPTDVRNIIYLSSPSKIFMTHWLNPMYFGSLLVPGKKQQWRISAVTRPNILTW